MCFRSPASVICHPCWGGIGRHGVVCESFLLLQITPRISLQLSPIKLIGSSSLDFGGVCTGSVLGFLSGVSRLVCCVSPRKVCHTMCPLGISLRSQPLPPLLAGHQQLCSAASPTSQQPEKLCPDVSLETRVRRNRSL